MLEGTSISVLQLLLRTTVYCSAYFYWSPPAEWRLLSTCNYTKIVLVLLVQNLSVVQSQAADQRARGDKIFICECLTDRQRHISFQEYRVHLHI